MKPQIGRRAHEKYKSRDASLLMILYRGHEMKTWSQSQLTFLLSVHVDSWNAIRNLSNGILDEVLLSCHLFLDEYLSVEIRIRLWKHILNGIQCVL